MLNLPRDLSQLMPEIALTLLFIIVNAIITSRRFVQAIDVEVLEFEEELSDPDFVCHWSLWTERACLPADKNKRCQAELHRKCICLKFARSPHQNSSAGYKTRTCSFGTLQTMHSKPDGRCDANCQLLDAFFRRLEGLDGAWCPWTNWELNTCRVGKGGDTEGYQHSFRQCVCPPSWMEGHPCPGSDTRTRNCREALSDMTSGFLQVWTRIFTNAIVGIGLPLALIAWFCCLAQPIRQGMQYGRLQSAAVEAELFALRGERRRQERHVQHRQHRQLSQQQRGEEQQRGVSAKDSGIQT